MKRDKVINWLLGITVVALVLFTILSYLEQGTIYHLFKGDAEALSNSISLNGFAVLLFIILIALESVIAPIPAIVLYVAGGLIFGPFLGSVYALIGSILGAGVAFQLSRNWARSYFEKRVSIKMRNKFDRFSLKYGALAIFLLRINPLTTSDLFSYIAGLSKMKFWKFIVWTGLGLFPLILAQTYVGHAISGNTFLINTFMLTSVIYVVGFILIFIYLEWNKKRKEKKKENAKLSQNKKRQTSNSRRD